MNLTGDLKNGFSRRLKPSVWDVAGRNRYNRRVHLQESLHMTLAFAACLVLAAATSAWLLQPSQAPSEFSMDWPAGAP